jgi:hypothetical protein
LDGLRLRRVDVAVLGGAVKGFLLASVALFAMGVSIPADAADLGVKAPLLPAPPAPYNWSGLYLGANIGGAFSNGTTNIAGTTWDPGATEFIGGFQVGYNWQFGHLLVGVEGTFDWATFSRPNIPLGTPLGTVQASANQNWISTLAGRFGITSDKWLYYGKVGGGWAEDRASVSLPNGTSWTGSSTIGAGWLAEESNTPSSPTGRSNLSTTISGWEIGRRPPYPRSVGTAISR